MIRAIVDLARRARAAPSDGQLYGMEVEAEGMSPADALDRVWPEGTLRRWAIVEDGSLRNGLEFVSVPLTARLLREAVQALYTGAFRPDGVHPSVRTGIHIHASCLHLNTDQVLRICQHYALLEPLLFKAAGGQREENIYCIPWYRAHDTPKGVYRVLGQAGDADLCKYSALHVAPLFKYGTLEYRHAPTFDTWSEAATWVDLVAAVHETYQTTYDVLDEWARLGPSAFAERVFGRDLGWEQAFDALDLERVCELLRPSKLVAHDGWGIPPMLNTPGNVIALSGGGLITPRSRRNRARAMDTILAAAQLRARQQMWFDPSTGDMTIQQVSVPDEPEEEHPEPEEYDGPEYEPEWDDEEPEPMPDSDDEQQF